MKFLAVVQSSTHYWQFSTGMRRVGWPLISVEFEPLRFTDEHVKKTALLIIKINITIAVYIVVCITLLIAFRNVSVTTGLLLNSADPSLHTMFMIVKIWAVEAQSAGDH